MEREITQKGEKIRKPSLALCLSSHLLTSDSSSLFYGYVQGLMLEAAEQVKNER